MIKNIVFDMGNVLVSYDALRYVDKFFHGNQDEKELLLQEVFQSAEWVSTDRGTMTEVQAVTAICKRLPQKLHFAVREMFYRWHEDIPLFPEMEDLIIRLKKAGYSIYLLSNTCKSYHDFKKNIPAISHMDGEFISADWRLLKPDIAIYHTFCSHFGLVPAECFFIDDTPANIEGAIYMGMQGFIFRKNVGALESALRDAGISIGSVK